MRREWTFFSRIVPQTLLPFCQGIHPCYKKIPPVKNDPFPQRSTRPEPFFLPSPNADPSFVVSNAGVLLSPNSPPPLLGLSLPPSCPEAQENAGPSKSRTSNVFFPSVRAFVFIFCQVCRPFHAWLPIGRPFFLSQLARVFPVSPLSLPLIRVLKNQTSPYTTGSAVPETPRQQALAFFFPRLRCSPIFLVSSLNSCPLCRGVKTSLFFFSLAL